MLNVAYGDVFVWVSMLESSGSKRTNRRLLYFGVCFNTVYLNDKKVLNNREMSNTCHSTSLFAFFGQEIVKHDQVKAV